MRPMDALEAVQDWRPQTYGSRNAKDARDPIVEPLWSGIRFLGAVSGGETVLQDADGDRLDGFPALAAALAEATTSHQVIVDGYVTAEVSHDGTGTYTGGDNLDSATKVVTQTLMGSRPGSDDKRLDQGRAARMPRGDDPVALVLVDLIWLDGIPLLDIPLLERRRLLESVITESDVVRRGIFVRPPIDSWVGSWRSMGFPGMSFKSANGRYAPGAAAADWASVAMPRR
jgi:hypothetical protein